MRCSTRWSTRLRWDEAIQRWRIATNRGDDIRARFVVMAGGPLNMPKLPGIPGIEDFKGKMFHTARWDYDVYRRRLRENPVLDKLADKRVAIIGTGATAIQAIPYLGQYAKQLYVLQRTPSRWMSAATTADRSGMGENAQARLAEGAADEFPSRRDGACWHPASRI